MFKVEIDTKVIIEDCPKNGLAAIEFRRANGIPEAPTNVVELKYTATDEAICKRFADYLDGNADLIVEMDSRIEPSYRTRGKAEALVSPPWGSGKYMGRHTIPARVIAAFLGEPDKTRVDGVAFALIEALAQAAEDAARKAEAEREAEDRKRKEKIRAAVAELEAMSEEELIKDGAYRDTQYLVGSRWKPRIDHRFRDVLTTSARERGYPNPEYTVPEALHLAKKVQDAVTARNAAEKQMADEAKRAADKERVAWIEAHGSDRLKRCVKEGIECDAAYRDERLKAERPGWSWVRHLDGDLREPRNPIESAFVLLDEARTISPDARLAFRTVDHECDEDCAGEDGCPTYDWTGYVAVADFLGEKIVLFAKQD